MLALHRRAGKTELAIMELIDKAMKFKLDLGMFVYIAPFLKQAKAIAWQRLKQKLGPLAGILASLIWTPVGIYVGLRPRLTRIVQPVAQFLAAFPNNLLFPLAVSLIVAWKLNVNIWLSPLLVLGPQWYILFNVILLGAGADSKNYANPLPSVHFCQRVLATPFVTASLQTR